MSEFWFDASHIDLDTGEVIEDDVAQVRLESKGGNIIHLGSLVLAKDFPYSREDFTGELVDQRREQIETWEGRECQDYGRWLSRLIETRSGQPLGQTDIRRLEVMGLGPGDKSLLRKVGATSIARFREQIGIPLGRRKGTYDYWGPEEYAAYALRLSTKLGRKPRRPDYIAAAQRGEGPGIRIIRNSVVHSLAGLNELIGFPDTTTMTAWDMVYWGSSVRRANSGIPLTTTVASVLSKRSRGPSFKHIYGFFDDWQEYVGLVNEHYERETNREEQSRRSKLKLYEEMIGKGILSTETVPLTEEALLALGGRHQLVESLAPSLTPKQKAKIISSSSMALVPNFLNVQPHLSAGVIECEAVMLGIFDDIWPLDDGLQYLVISDEELRTEQKLTSKKAGKP